jgi:hypothetical protein
MSIFTNRLCFVTATVTACALSLAITKVSNAVATVADCDGTRPGRPKRCIYLDEEATCEKTPHEDCVTGTIGIYNVQSFAIDTVASNSSCKTILASGTNAICGEQWYCKGDLWDKTCSKGLQVKDDDGNPVYTYQLLYKQRPCRAVGCNQ